MTAIRIFEDFKKVTPSDSFPSFAQSEEDAFEILEAAGWTYKTSGGNNTHIFKSPDNKHVARINSLQDYGFAIYADLCMSLKDNPYLQTVHNHFTLKDGTHVTIMDRLIPSYMGIGKNLTTRNQKAYDLYLFLHEGFDHPELEDHLFEDAHLREALRALFSALDNRYRCINDLSPGLDTHDDNIMLHPKSGHPVISDPFSQPCGPNDENNWIEAVDPWTVHLRRRLGMMDPNYMKNIPDFEGNSWILR